MVKYLSPHALEVKTITESLLRTRPNTFEKLIGNIKNCKTVMEVDQVSVKLSSTKCSCWLNNKTTDEPHCKILNSLC